MNDPCPQSCLELGGNPATASFLTPCEFFVCLFSKWFLCKHKIDRHLLPLHALALAELSFLMGWGQRGGFWLLRAHKCQDAFLGLMWFFTPALYLTAHVGLQVQGIFNFS